MGLTELISQAKSSAEAVNSFLDSAKNHNKALAVEAEKAIGKYFADRDEKQRKIAESIADMNRKKQSIEASIKSMQPLLVDAIASGKEDNVQRLQGRITELTAQTMSLDEQVKMLLTTVVHGDDDLYAEAEKKADKVFKDNDMLGELYDLIHNFAKKQKDFWYNIERATTTLTERGLFMPGHRLAIYDKMQEEHKKTIRSSAEMSQNALASEKKPHNLETARYHSGSY